MGKTSNRVMEIIEDVCTDENKKQALLVSALHTVRNTYVAMLQRELSKKVFEKNVRVVGNKGLDDLTKTRTLSALVW